MQEGFQPPPATRLSDEAYAQALQVFVPLCADIVPINRAKRIFYLAPRRLKPMNGWWLIGGRMTPGETKIEAAARKFKAETGLAISQDRFKLVAFLEYRCKDRQQEPQEIGCHSICATFTVELTPDELASIPGNLDEREYDKDVGLSAFDRERLVKEKVFPSFIDLYDQVFGQKVT